MEGSISMKSWYYFFAAAFFGSYLMLSNGVPLLPVLAGVAVAALSMWLRTASARKTSNGSVGH
jgi:hypothetical protein